MRMSAIALVVAMLALSSGTPVSGASRANRSVAIVADVDGRPIKPAEISRYYCHDFDFPRIHCFAAGDRLRDAERARIATRSTLQTSVAANVFLTIFDGPNYSGAFMDVSQNYDALWTIGWNDRISSYKGRNLAKGDLWTDWFASGNGRLFCCNTNVASLAAGFDNAFSSVYRR